MNTLPDEGMTHLNSHHSASQTVTRLESVLASRGLTVFAKIDHSGEAAKVGLKMQPAVVIIFGSPKAGTPVMISSPTAALDLPLKALIWEDHEATVRLSYNTPEFLKERHNIPDELLANISGIQASAEEAVLWRYQTCKRQLFSRSRMLQLQRGCV